jgi:hypothetical protein
MNRGLRQSVVLLLGNLLLCVLIAQANHDLAPWQMRLWLGGLLLAPAALIGDYLPGAAAVFVTGLALDAVAPVWFGLQAFVLLAGHATLFSVRGRFARDDTTARVISALLANLATFLVLSLFAGLSHPSAPAPGVGRLLADLAASQLVLAVVTPWFFAAQERLLAFFRAKEHGLL